MTKLTRKSLFKRTSAGALMVGALGVVPGATALAAGQSEASHSDAELAALGMTAPFVVFVRNPKIGELVVIAGSQEIVVRDPALVARMWQAGPGAAAHAVKHKGGK